jgi:hypothetical protein
MEKGKEMTTREECPLMPWTQMGCQVHYSSMQTDGQAERNGVGDLGGGGSGV